MAFLGYFTPFCIAVLARLLRDIYNFSNRFASFSCYIFHCMQDTFARATHSA